MLNQGYLQNLGTTKRSNMKKNTFKVWKQTAEFFPVLAEFVHEDV